MKRRARITVRTEGVWKSYEGTVFKTGDGTEILYASEEGLTRLFFQERRADIRREGETPLTLTVDPGRASEAVYETAEGSISFTVHGESVVLKEGKDRLTCALRYKLFQNGQEVSRHTVAVIGEMEPESI